MRPQEQVRGAGPSPEQVKILLVDDRPENLVSLKAILDRPEYQLVTATSGDEALAHVLREQFAVILLDVAMPGLDGFETATLIRQRQQAGRIPIIFVSAAMQDVEHIFAGYQAGAVDYLLKPFDAHALTAKVDVFVALFRQAREIERKERALRETEHRERELLESLYDVTFEQAPVGIGHLSVDGRWLRVNLRLATILARTRDELLHLKLTDLMAPTDREAVRDDLRAVGSGSPRRRGEYRFVRPDGSLVWTALSITLLSDRAGKPVQLTIVEDISEEKRLIASLQAAEARFARLRDSGLLAIVHEATDGTIVDANDVFLRMIGYTREDLRARRINARDLTPPDFDDLEGRAREELRRAGVTHIYEKELRRKDGSRISVVVGAASIDLPEPGVIGFALDISERKQLEVERGRVMRELREGIQSRDDFLAIAAHELKAPLTPLMLQITSVLELVRQAKTPPEIQWMLRQLEPMERATFRLSQLVTTLLGVSRMTVGTLRLELEEVDLAAAAREVVERMRGEITRAACALTLHADTPVVGQWDRMALEQVVTNLLSNAVRYGAGKPVEVVVEGDARFARLAVRDHGIGIAPEDQRRIFERFERLAPVRHYGGFGVGLWLVRRIAEAHGGIIEVESRRGEGALFRLELPRVRPTRPAAPPTKGGE